MPTKIFYKLLSCLVCIIIGWILCNTNHQLNQQKEIHDVTTVEAGMDKIREKIGLSTKVQEKEVVNITSSVENGRVDRVFVRTGDFVTSG
ncbi:hypothetical protein KKE26_06915 [bacterium]|nr:hypothetical protein [bacterium]MBU1754136.1 hypothetical protein [bacterium]